MQENLNKWFNDRNKPDEKDAKLLVDGHYVAYRTKGILQLSKLEACGRKTGVAYGVMNTLRKLIKEGYKDIEFAWDVGMPEHRYSLHDGYKDGRAGGLTLSNEEINLARDFLKYMGIEQYWHPKLEADDVIATRCEEIDGEKLIYTTDKDYFQLLTDESIKIKNPKDILIDRDYIIDEYGIKPRKMVEYLALIGDDADNIDGIKGIGPVTARKYLNGEDLTENKREKIEDGEDVVDRNKNLIELKIADELEKMPPNKDKDMLNKMLQKYEMNSLYEISGLI